MDSNPLLQRRAGVLLHPTSLPSGTLNEAEQWIDWLSHCHFSIWQMLPLSIPDSHGSPYQSHSAFAMNTALTGQHTPRPEIHPAEFSRFIEHQSDWLTDFALYSILKNKFDDKPWYDWPDEFKSRDEASLLSFQTENLEAIDAVMWHQFDIFKRWHEIHEYARGKGIYLFGDLPIFVALDSSDVWSNPEQFLLDDELKPVYIAGVPPDYFSETGQRWGNPHYNWEQMQGDGFSWWKKRMKHAFESFDIIRIDHFRGLQASWMIPADAETAIDGFWQEAPGDELLSALENEFGKPAIVAEDLGVITDEVKQLRDSHRLPGMSILQFAFDAFEDNPHKPVNITPQTVVYSGTHDNNTSAGWFNGLLANEQKFVFEVLQTAPRQDIAHCLVEAAFHSNANTAIVPLQDLLQLDETARMNTPGQIENNWQWQFNWEQLDNDTCNYSQQHIDASGRFNAN